MSGGISRALDGFAELVNTERAINRMVGTRRKAVTEPDPHDMADKVLLLKLNKLEEQVEKLTEMVSQLCNDRYPRYVGTKEACKILGIGSTTMDKRLQAGYYPFAFKENGRWRFLLAELYKFAGQL